MRISQVPGLPPLLACAGLLAVWEIAAHVLDISGLPPAHLALAELPTILRDKESLFAILDSIRRMVTGFTLALAVATGASLEEAAALANHAAGVVVGKVGTASVTREELVASI